MKFVNAFFFVGLVNPWLHYVSGVPTASTISFKVDQNGSLRKSFTYATEMR